MKQNSRPDLIKIPYSVPPHQIKEGVTQLKADEKNISLKVFGDHNLLNLNAAKLVCKALNLTEKDFYEAIQSFKGAAKRLELLGMNERTVVFKDFAHSPSKVKATIHAVKKQYPDKKIVAVLELHTFSSLNQNFIEQYAGTMDEADKAIVFCDEHTLARKGTNSINLFVINNIFNNLELEFFTSSKNLEECLVGLDYDDVVLLLMSSGNFGNLNLLEINYKILSKY